MTWSDFYLICFAVGFCFSFISFVFGSPRLGRLHMPHFHGHGVPHIGAGHGVVEENHEPVPGEPLEGPLESEDQLSHDAVKLAKDPDDFFRLRGFRERGESSEVAKDDGDLPAVTLQGLFRSG